MNILCASNDNYAIGYAIMLSSLFENHGSQTKITVFFLYNDLSENSKNIIKNQVDKWNHNIEFIKVNDSDFKALSTSKYLSKECFYRIGCHLFLPDECKKILWLDGDIIVTDNLEGFYNQNIDEYLYLGISEDKHDEYYNDIKDRIDMPYEFDYISSGVLLINVEKAREIINLEEVYEYVIKHRKRMLYNDQDVINGMYYQYVKACINDDTWKYNYQTFGLDKTKLKNAIIVHYADKPKPWQKNYDGIGFGLYWKYGKKIQEARKVYDNVIFSHIFAYNKRNILNVILFIKGVAYIIMPAPIWKFAKKILKR